MLTSACPRKIWPGLRMSVRNRDLKRAPERMTKKSTDCDRLASGVSVLVCFESTLSIPQGSTRRGDLKQTTSYFVKTRDRTIFHTSISETAGANGLVDSGLPGMLLIAPAARSKCSLEAPAPESLVATAAYRRDTVAGPPCKTVEALRICDNDLRITLADTIFVLSPSCKTIFVLSLLCGCSTASIVTAPGGLARSRSRSRSRSVELAEWRGSGGGDGLAPLRVLFLSSLA